MKTKKVKRCAVRIVLVVGVTSVAMMIVSSIAYGGSGQPAGQGAAGPVTMIDPFEIKIIWVSESPSSPGGNDFSGFMTATSGPLVRIPDRPMVRSVFKPLP